MSTFGYSGKILKVDLSTRTVSDLPTMDYAEKYLGGRGFGTKIFWDDVDPNRGAFDPENRLIFATGPLCGIPVIGGSRWTVCGKSPEPYYERFSYGNCGGVWGAALKFTGYDAIIVFGTSEKPVYLFLHDESAEFMDATSHLGSGAIETREALKNEHGNAARVVAIGPAGENRAVMSVLTADNDAVCTGGLGAVMGSKNLKAIVVRSNKRKFPIAHPDSLNELKNYYRGLGRNFTEQLARWSRHIFNDFRLVPNQEMKKEPCFGCLGRCCRKTYQAKDGKKGKFMCHAAYFYQPHAERYYREWNDVPFHANKLCDSYGLDAKALDLMINWLVGCYKAGIINEKSTGIPFSKVGSLEFIETLVRKISFREGFGDLLAKGVKRAAEEMGQEAKYCVEKAGYLDEPGNNLYGPRLYITNAIFHAMEPRIPIQQVHEVGLLIPQWLIWVLYGIGHVTTDVLHATAERFWGSEIASDFTTYEGKALAAKMIQDRQYAKESLILCDYLWPLTDLPNTEDHVGDPTLESKILTAVTGMEVGEKGLYRIGERIFNLQRAIHVREGHMGRDFDVLPESTFDSPLNYDISNPDCIVPGKNGEPVSRKGAVVEREKFEEMKDEYYMLRQWDVATGLQTTENLNALGLSDVAKDLEKRGLLGSTH